MTLLCYSHCLPSISHTQKKKKKKKKNTEPGTYETREALSYQRFILNVQKKVSNIRPSILRNFRGDYDHEQVSCVYCFLNVILNVNGVSNV